MEVLLHLLFALLVALCGPLGALGILAGALIVFIVFAVVHARRHGLGPAPASAEGHPLIDADALIEAASAVENPIVAFEFAYDEARAAQRVALFHHTGPRLQLPSFFWLAKAESDQCRARLRAAGIRTAMADTERSGGWHCVHSDDGGPVLLWASRRTQPAVVEVAGCWVIRFGGRTRVVDKSEIVGVEAWASASWNRHEVRLHVTTSTGTEVITVARKRVPVAFHYFYDGLDFDWDAAWAIFAGRALAQRLGLELTRTGEFEDKTKTQQREVSGSISTEDPVGQEPSEADCRARD